MQSSSSWLRQLWHRPDLQRSAILTPTSIHQDITGWMQRWHRFYLRGMPFTVSGTIPFFRIASPSETLIVWHFLRLSGVTSSNSLFYKGRQAWYSVMTQAEVSQ